MKSVTAAVRFSAVSLFASATLLGLAGCGYTNALEETAAALNPRGEIKACEPVFTPGAISSELPASWTEMPRSVPKVNPENVPVTQRSWSFNNALQTLTPELYQQNIAGSGSVVAAEIGIYDGATGKALYTTLSNPAGVANDFIGITPEIGVAGVADAMRCAVPGQQLRIVFSAAESLQFVQQFGLTAGANAVFLAQVNSVSMLKAEGEIKRLPAGFPAVTRTAEGVPGIVLPPQAAPNKLQTAIAIKGSGVPVSPSHNLIVRFTSVSWESGEVIASNWGDLNSPQLLAATAANDLPWRKQLNDVPVGSQVVVVLPGDEVNPASAMVIDILLAG